MLHGAYSVLPLLNLLLSYSPPTWYLQHPPQAKAFADGVHAKFPGKLLAYNCSPSFNWAKHLKDEQIASFQQARPLLTCCLLSIHCSRQTYCSLHERSRFQFGFRWAKLCCPHLRSFSTIFCQFHPARR